MTDRLELLGELCERGITVEAVDDNLLAKPAELVASDIVARIRECKPALLDILAGQTDICERCRGQVVRDRTFDGYWNRICVDCGCWHAGLRPDGRLCAEDSKPLETETKVIQTAEQLSFVSVSSDFSKCKATDRKDGIA